MKHTQINSSELMSARGETVREPAVACAQVEDVQMLASFLHRGKYLFYEGIKARRPDLPTAR